MGPLRLFISRPGTIAKASFPPVPAETRRHLTPFHLHPNWAMACPPPNRPRRTSPPHPRDGSPSRNLWTSKPGRFASPADARASRRHLGVSLVSTTSRPPRFACELLSSLCGSLRRRAAFPGSRDLPSTHSRARIQPRSASFAIAKTMRSGVPHCKADRIAVRAGSESSSRPSVEEHCERSGRSIGRRGLRNCSAPSSVIQRRLKHPLPFALLVMVGRKDSRVYREVVRRLPMPD